MKLIYVLVLCFCTLTTSAQTIEEVLLDQIMDDVEFLADDMLQGRETGTQGEAMAAGYIAARFQEIGFSPMGDNGTYFQQFDGKHEYNPHSTNEVDTTTVITGTNVIGFLDQGAPTTIVLGGHYDHLGWGGEGSLHPGESNVIHNGADDNASGIATILLLGQGVAETVGLLPNHNFLIIAFSGEEKGLWGSNYFCKNPTVDLATIAYMLNFDMVGRLNDERTLAINGVGTSPVWIEHLEELDVDSIQIVTTESGVGPSDHTSFYLQDIPVLHFFTGQHEDYHKPTDDANLVNYEGILSVCKYVIELMVSFKEVENLEFAKTKDSSDDTPTYSVTLGVVPDYLFDGKGMRIDGVSEDRPAANAGIIKGDVVIKMGDLEIADMMGYMEALGQFEKGDSTTVVVDRDGKEKEFKVTF